MDFRITKANKDQVFLQTVSMQICSLLSKFEAVKVTLSEYKNKRSLSANALYWMWLSEISNAFKNNSYEYKEGDETITIKYTKDDFHDYFRHRYLGYSPRKSILDQNIQERLKSTTKLNSTEFCYYLSQIDTWAATKGIYLKRPEDSEYSKWSALND